MVLFTAQLYPNRALGFLALGASLHDIVTRLKAEPQRFPQLNLVYSQHDPVHEPVIIHLPANGIRLQFDGAEQRLRLIEILDFSKTLIKYKDQDLVRLPTTEKNVRPPTFRHIYDKFLGPAYPGEFIPDPSNDPHSGTYVLSYPGVAFTFALPQALYSYAPQKDVVSLLASAPNQYAQSMAIFQGNSWKAARPTLWTEILPSIKSNAAVPRGKEAAPDEISLIRIHGGGRVEFRKKWSHNRVFFQLGETTPQEVVAELGPPDAIYRKNDQRMSIHKQLITGDSDTSYDKAGRQHRRNSLDFLREESTTSDTEQSSSFVTSSDDSDSDDDLNSEDERAAAGNISNECFYNYFYLGFDILVSTPVAPSPAPPLSEDEPLSYGGTTGAHASQLVATKLVLHGNLPGSYEFNRHRRVRWEIAYLASSDENREEDADNDYYGGENHSETKFPALKDQLVRLWTTALPESSDAPAWETGMVLNRGWGDGMGHSCELPGGGHWEASAQPPTTPSSTSSAILQPIAPKKGEGDCDSPVDLSSTTTTTLYGLPGLVFEVTRSGYVNAVTVF